MNVTKNVNAIGTVTFSITDMTPHQARCLFAILNISHLLTEAEHRRDNIVSRDAAERVSQDIFNDLKDLGVEEAQS